LGKKCCRNSSSINGINCSIQETFSPLIRIIIQTDKRMRKVKTGAFDDGGHAQSAIKENSRRIFALELREANPDRDKPINIVGLSGSEFMFEIQTLSELGIKHNTLSIEKDKKPFLRAKKNKPDNVTVVRGNILDYKYMGFENALNFDFCFARIDKNINLFIEWLYRNQFTKPLTLNFTVEARARGMKLKGEKSKFNYDDIFPDYDGQGIVDHLSMYINNNFVHVSKAIVTHYANVDKPDEEFESISNNINNKKIDIVHDAERKSSSPMLNVVFRISANK
jgi:hypothetical protein